MKKIATFLLAMVTLLTLCVPAFATDSEGPIYRGKPDLVSVETVSNEDLSGVATPFGLNRPKLEWDLTSDGRYSFHGLAEPSFDICSSYYFVGHNGRARLQITEDSELWKDWTYTVKVYERGVLDSTIYTYECFYYSTYSFTLSDFDEDAEIYFEVIAIRAPVDFHGYIEKV